MLFRLAQQRIISRDPPEPAPLLPEIKE